MKELNGPPKFNMSECYFHFLYNEKLRSRARAGVYNENGRTAGILYESGSEIKIPY